MKRWLEVLMYCIYPRYWDTLTPLQYFDLNFDESILLSDDVTKNFWMSLKQCKPCFDTTFSSF